MHISGVNIQPELNTITHYNHCVPVIYLVSIFIFLKMCGFFFFQTKIFAMDTLLKISIIMDPFTVFSLANCSSTPSEKHDFIQNNTLNHWSELKGRHQQYKMTTLQFPLHGKSAQCFAVPCTLSYMAYTYIGSTSGKSTKACRCWEMLEEVEEVEAIWCEASRYALLFINRMT